MLINSPFDDCIVLADFFITIVSNFTQFYKLFSLTGKRMYDTVLFFLGADKWPEMKKNFLELG